MPRRTLSWPPHKKRKLRQDIMTEVISVPRQPDGHPYFSPTPSLPRSNSSQTSLRTGSPKTFPSSPPKPRPSSTESVDCLVVTPHTYLPSPPQSSPTEASHSSSFASTPASSISSSVVAGEEDGLSFPTYNDDTSFPSTDEEPTCPPNTACQENLPFSYGNEDPVSDHSPLPPPTAIDDTSVRIEPSRHVDYLSHDWREEDIWSSWRHIVSKRRIYGERSRLENASWRTWAKSKYGLRTVSPETLNWSVSLGFLDNSSC